MQTLKTAVVVVLLIAVCYGAFVALNAPDDEIPIGIQEWANGDALGELGTVDLSGGFAVDTSSAVPMSGDSWPTASQTLPLPNVPATPGAEASQTPAQFAGGLPELPAIPAPAQPASDVVNVGSAGGVPELPTLPSLDGAGDPNQPLAQLPGSPAGSAPTANQSTPSDPAASVSNVPGGSGTPGSLVSATLGSVSSAADSGVLPGPELPLPDFADTTAGNLLSPPTLPLPSEQSASLSTGEEVTPTPSPTVPTSVPDLPFEVAREKALAMANQSDLRMALELLSSYYESPELGSAEHADLVNILDALSREVIYSKRHLFESAYHVMATDTVTSIAEAHRITPELLAAINGLGASKALLAKAKLKVVRGPFHARISLSRREMTLFLGNLYAGRFPVTIGGDDPPTVGTYNVVDRRTDRTYYGPGGMVIQAGEPENPYGGYWLSLGNNLSIHGSPEMARSDLATAGCISLAPLDAADAYIILTKDSRVEIRQ